MFRLFTEMPANTGGSYKPGSWPALERAIRHTTEQITEYYRSTTMSTSAQHFLNKILAYFGSDVTTPTIDLYRKMQSSWLPIAQTQQMTAINSSGRTFPGVFYGPGIEEVILCVSQAFDWDWVVQNWRTVSPVTVLQHPFTNDDFNLPNGMNHTSLRGYAVIQLDIPLLILQYHAFRLYEIYEIKPANPDYVLKTPFQFLHMFVLPGLLESHIDNVVLNRLRTIVLGGTFEQSSNKHAFYTTQYASRIDGVLKPLANQLASRRQDFGTTMRSIPMVFKESAFELARYPKVLRTKQNKWALAASRLNILELLFALDALAPSGDNQVWIQDIHREIDYYHSERGWATQVPRLIRDEVVTRIDRLREYRT